MARKTNKSRLPKAPLAEVVFELRWALQDSADSPPVLHSDPGLMPLLTNFTSHIKKAGFASFKDMSPALQTGAHGVARRFYKRAGSEFPIMQIGPGIFATNESAAYEWKTFKAQVVRGLNALLQSYPKLDFFSIRPIHIELRYIDAFDRSLFGNASLFDFLHRGTTVKIEFPFAFDANRFDGDVAGRLVIARKVKGSPDTSFVCDIGSGRKNDTQEEIVRLETKVFSVKSEVPSLKAHKKFLADVETWLERAHSVTSPFFKQFVTPALMKKFGG